MPPAVPPVPGPSERRSPPALVTSIVFGAAGLVVLLSGLVTRSDALVVGGVGAGSVSLVAALVWRGQLIEAWQARRRTDDGP